MRQLIFSAGLILLCPFLVLAQKPENSKSDSLEAILASDAPDTSKIKAYNSLGYEYRRTDPVKAMDYAMKSIDLSIRCAYSEGEANAYLLLGILNKNMGNFDVAADYYFKALKISEKLGDKVKQSSCLNNIGSVYQAQNNPDKAKDYYRQSLEIEQKIGNREQISIRYYNLGTVYEMADSLDKAYTFYYNSLLIEQELGNHEGEYYAYYGIAGVDGKRGYYDRAMESINKALDIARNINYVDGIAICMNERGKLFNRMNQYGAAIQCFDSCIYYANRVNLRNEIRDAYRNLSLAYSLKGDDRNAFRYLTAYVELNDSINSLEVSNQVAELEARFRMGKKEQEIEMLKEINEFESKKTENEKKQKYYLLFTFVLCTVLLISNLHRILADLRKIILFSSGILLFLLILSLVLFVFGGNVNDGGIEAFLIIFSDVLIIAVLPVFIFVIIAERFLLNRNLKSAREISEQIKQIPVKENVKRIELSFEGEKGIFSCNLNDLVCCEANDNYTAVYHYKDGKLKKELFRGTLRKTEEQLSSVQEIVRCHKSYIVNISQIVKLTGNAQGHKLHFKDLNLEVPVSRKFPKALLDQIRSMI